MSQTNIVNFATAKLAKERGFDVYCQIKYLEDGETTHLPINQDRKDVIFAPTFEELQTWLESKGMYLSVAPEFYQDGINWLWQVLWYRPKEQWKWNESENDDGEQVKYPEQICTGTGYYGDNGEYPTRYDALKAALHMGLMKLDIYNRHNSIDQLAKLYRVDNNTMLNRIREFSSELGDWSFREFTPEQLKIIVEKIGAAPQ